MSQANRYIEAGENHGGLPEAMAAHHAESRRNRPPDETLRHCPSFGAGGRRHTCMIGIP
jgi:hypothetical protein